MKSRDRRDGRDGRENGERKARLIVVAMTIYTVSEKYHAFLEISEKVTHPWLGGDGRVRKL